MIVLARQVIIGVELVEGGRDKNSFIALIVYK